MDKNESPYEINPVVKELLGVDGPVFQIDGYMGPSDAEHVHFYKDLGLGRYVEISRKDIVRVVPFPGHPNGRSRLFVKASAEFRLVNESRMKGDHILSALASVPASADPATIERIYPPDNCPGHCQIDYITCIRHHDGDFWCAAQLTACVLACMIFSPEDFPEIRA